MGGTDGSGAPLSLSHVASAHVRAEPAAAFAYLADPERLGRWSLGCFSTAFDEAAGLYSGTSLYDGARGWFSIDADAERGVIDYSVGSPGNLVRRISARVVPAFPLGYAPGTSLVLLTAWRPAAMPGERWARLCAAHEAEIGLVKAQIEAESAPRSPRAG